MWRHDDEGARERGGSWWLPALRIVVLSVLVAIPIVPVVFLLLPMPEGADGITLCLPWIGPMQQFAEGLDEDLDELVHLHERVHAEQCRRLGSFEYARTYLRDEGMLTLEAEAFCAEARMLALRGRDTGPWVSRIVETLYHDYPHSGTVEYAEVLQIVGTWCPPPDARSGILTQGPERQDLSHSPGEAPAPPLPSAPDRPPDARRRRSAPLRES